MRIVTNQHLGRLQDVVAAVGALSRRGSAEVAIASQQVTALAEGGREDDSRAADAKAVSRAHLLMVDMGARLEIAAVGFLGERRWPGESVPDYLERISGLCADLSTMLAAQRANGLEYRP